MPSPSTHRGAASVFDQLPPLSSAPPGSGVLDSHTLSELTNNNKPLFPTVEESLGVHPLADAIESGAKVPAQLLASSGQVSPVPGPAHGPSLAAVMPQAGMLTSLSLLQAQAVADPASGAASSSMVAPNALSPAEAPGPLASLGESSTYFPLIFFLSCSNCSDCSNPV